VRKAKALPVATATAAAITAAAITAAATLYASFIQQNEEKTKVLSQMYKFKRIFKGQSRFSFIPSLNIKTFINFLSKST